MNYDRVYNFSAGPSMLPEKVLEQVRDDLLNYKGTGESVMEMSHRSKEYMAIIEDAEADLRDLLDIPENYKVIFVQGGATTQFSMVPLNLMRNSHKADYVVTGSWAKKAAKEATDAPLTSVTVQDVYEGEEGKSATLTLRFAFSAPDRTLTKQELAPAMDAICEKFTAFGLAAQVIA